MNTPKSFKSHRHFYQYVDNLSCRAESGFRHVEAKKYTPRLLHVFGEKVKCFSIMNVSFAGVKPAVNCCIVKYVEFLWPSLGCIGYGYLMELNN